MLVVIDGGWCGWCGWGGCPVPAPCRLRRGARVAGWLPLGRACPRARCPNHASHCQSVRGRQELRRRHLLRGVRRPSHASRPRSSPRLPLLRQQATAPRCVQPRPRGPCVAQPGAWDTIPGRVNQTAGIPCHQTARATGSGSDLRLAPALPASPPGPPPGLCFVPPAPSTPDDGLSPATPAACWPRRPAHNGRSPSAPASPDACTARRYRPRAGRRARLRARGQCLRARIVHDALWHALLADSADSPDPAFIPHPPQIRWTRRLYTLYVAHLSATSIQPLASRLPHLLRLLRLPSASAAPRRPASTARSSLLTHTHTYMRSAPARRTPSRLRPISLPEHSHPCSVLGLSPTGLGHRSPVTGHRHPAIRTSTAAAASLPPAATRWPRPVVECRFISWTTITCPPSPAEASARPLVSLSRILLVPHWTDRQGPSVTSLVTCPVPLAITSSMSICLVPTAVARVSNLGSRGPYASVLHACHSCLASRSFLRSARF